MKTQSLEILDRKGNGREQGEGKLAPPGFTGLLSSALESSPRRADFIMQPTSCWGRGLWLRTLLQLQVKKHPLCPRAHNRVSPLVLSILAHHTRAQGSWQSSVSALDLWRLISCCRKVSGSWTIVWDMSTKLSLQESSSRPRHQDYAAGSTKVTDLEAKSF